MEEEEEEEEEGAGGDGAGGVQLSPGVSSGCLRGSE